MSNCKSTVSVVVSFDLMSYTVIEGDDGFVELKLVRSGDLSIATVAMITVNGSTTGIYNIICTKITFTWLFFQLILITLPL